MRPGNILITGIGIFVAGLIAGGKHEMYTTMILASLSGVFLTSSGNIMNDLHDVEIDRVNKPYRILASGKLSKAEARAWNLICIVAGLILSLIVSLPTFSIAVGSIIMMYLYSAHLKRIPFIGNVTVGVLTGVAFIYGSFVVGNPAAGIIPAFFACVYNIGREIMKDIEDTEGDIHGGIVTFPIRYGNDKAIMLSILFFSLIIISSLIPFFISRYNHLYLWIVLFGVDSLLLVVIYFLLKKPTKNNLHKLNTLLRYDMVVGIAAIYVGTT